MSDELGGLGRRCDSWHGKVDFKMYCPVILVLLCTKSVRSQIHIKRVSSLLPISWPSFFFFFFFVHTIHNLNHRSQEGLFSRQNRTVTSQQLA